MRGAAPRIARLPGRGSRLAIALAVAAGLAACAGTRIEGGTFYSSKGYQVTLPAEGWVVDGAGGSDLTLRHVALPAAMLVNADCRGSVGSRTNDVLTRHLFLGVRDRVPIERGETTVAGWPAVHTVIDGRADPGSTPSRIGAYVVKGERCVYDFVYVAPPGAFASRRADFLRLIQSFRAE